MSDTSPKLPELYMLIGPPAAGKSTYACNLKARLVDSVLISLDQLRGEISESLSIPLRMVMDTPSLRAKAEQAYCEAITDAVQDNKSIVLDASHTTPEFRKKILNLIQKPYKKIAIVLQPIHTDHSIQTGLGRDSERIRKGEEPNLIPYRIHHKRNQELSIPTSEEGFDEIRNFTVKWESKGFSIR